MPGIHHDDAPDQGLECRMEHKLACKTALAKSWIAME